MTTVPPNPPLTDDPVTATEALVETTEAAPTLMESVKAVEGPVEANMSAIASAKADHLETTASAIGMARVEGDADFGFSAVGISTAKGSANMHQSYASAFVGSTEMNVSQSATPMMLARTITFEQGATAIAAASDVTVRRGFVGIAVGGKVDIAEDSRVLLTDKALVVLALVVFGGLIGIAAAMAWSANRVAQRIPKFGRSRT